MVRRVIAAIIGRGLYLSSSWYIIVALPFDDTVLDSNGLPKKRRTGRGADLLFRVSQGL